MLEAEQRAKFQCSVWGRRALRLRACEQIRVVIEPEIAALAEAEALRVRAEEAEGEEHTEVVESHAYTGGSSWKIAAALATTALLSFGLGLAVRARASRKGQ